MAVDEGKLNQLIGLYKISWGLFFRVLTICSALGIAHAQQPGPVNTRTDVTQARFLSASVKAAPDLKCKLHAPQSSPASGITVFTDGDGYARFHAVRLTNGSPNERLILSCADRDGRASSYPVNLTEDATFAPRPLDLANEPGVNRPALTGDPLSYTQAQLSQEGYGLRPDPVTDPASYTLWHDAATRPGRMLSTTRSNEHTHGVVIQPQPGSAWIGTATTGSAPYVSMTASFIVPALVPGADATTSTEASIWPGLGGFPGGFGLIQTGVTLQTTSTTANYLTWSEYCCGALSVPGGFTPSQGDKILAQVWYCDANGQLNIGGGFGCTYLYDFQSGAVYSCVIPPNLPSKSPCPSTAALPSWTGIGRSAELIMENQSGQLKPPSDQFPVFAPDVTMSGIAVTGRGKISTTTTDPAVTLLSDYPHRPPAIFVTITDTGDTSFIADPVFPAQQHVFYRTKASPILPNSSAIGHIFYDTLGRRLFADDWTGLANAAAAAGDPATFALGYQQHVFYRDVPGNIQHIFYDAISQLLVTDNWRQLSGAPFAAGDAATMTTPGQQHVFYRDKGGHVQHILYDAGSAKLANDDWSQKANLVAQSVLAAGDPATMTTPGQQHVFYRDKRGHVQHMLSDGSPNVFSDDWSQKANLVNQSVLAAGDPATMTTPEQQHVFYRDKRGHVQHMLSDGSPSVFSDDWSQKANLVNQPVLAAGEPATMVTPNQQHVFYRGGGHAHPSYSVRHGSGVRQ